MGSGKLSGPSKAALVNDLKTLHQGSPGNITRNFYRANGKFSESQWQKHFAKFTDFLAAAGIENSTPQPETSEITGDSWTISLPKTSIHTLDELLDHCKVNLAEWTVDKFIVNKWEANEGGGRGIKDVYQVKAWLKRRGEVIAVRNEIAELKKDAKQEARIPKRLFRPLPTSGNMLELTVPDIHFGKLAWAAETGYRPYDTKIAAATFMRALGTLLERVRGYSFDQVVFVVGNDILNSDDIDGHTTSGTSVSNDGRYHKTFWKVRSTMVDAIEQLREVAPVKVIIVPGNHDTLAAWHLGDSLECYFHKYEDVQIDNEPTPRKYHQFGNVLLMFTHGHQGKREDYPLLMATERPEMFGGTKFREAHTGHIHQTRTQEFHGVRVRILPALCPPDAWHSNNGFVGNQQSAEAYVWNRTEGLIAQMYYNDDAEAPIVTKRELVSGTDIPQTNSL